MKFTFDELKSLRDEGYTDDQIASVLAEDDSSIGDVFKEGFTLEQITSTISGQSIPEGFTAQPAEPDRDFFSVEDVFSALGGVPEALAVGLPAAAVKGYQGLSMPERSQAIENEMAFAQRVQQDQEDREAAGKATSVGSAIRGALPSLGFSATNLPIAIGAGMAGTAVGGPIAGTASAMAASGTASYRMAGADLLYRAFKTLEENKGSPLTEEEKADAYRELLPFAQDSGLWEAGPEAVSNVLMMKAGKFIFGFGKGKAKELVGEAIEKTNKTLARKIAEKTAVGVGTAGAEVLSEGVTALGQFPAEKAVTKYAMTGEAAGGVTEYPGGYVQAVKDVAPSTLALTGLMGLGAGGVKLASMPFRQQKTPEQIKQDNIDLDAEREANSLMISPTDEEAKGLQAGVERMRQSAQEKKEIYSALEPNDPATQQLGMEIRELEKAVGLAEAEIAKRVTPESEQARLAREIAAEQEGKATKTGKAIDPELTNSIGKMVGLSRDGGLTLEEGFAYRSVGEGEVGSIAQEGYMITDPRLVGKEKKPRGQTTQKMFSELNPDAPNAAYGKKDIVIRVRKENVPVGTKGQAVREGDVEVLSYDGTQWVAQTPAEFAQARKPTAEVPTVTPAPVSETITEPSVVPEEGALVSEVTPAPPTPATAKVDNDYLAAVENGDTKKAQELLQTEYAKFVNSNVSLPVGNKFRSYPVTFIRFGDIPTDKSGKQIASRDYKEGVKEKGVSVVGVWYDPKRKKYLIPSGSEQAVAGISDLTIQERKVNIVEGDVLDDVGSDGEPLLIPGTIRPVKSVNLSELVEENNPYFTLDGEQYDPGIPGTRNSYTGAPEMWWTTEGREFPSTDTVVRDESGNVIPLSQRFPAPTPTTPPAVSETITPAEPAGIAIGNRVKTKTTPQSFVVEEVLPQSEREVELGEQYYRIKNERTGEMQTVEAKDINPIKAPKATKKMAPIRVKEKATPVPEAERYTFDEAGIRAINFFGGKAPKGLIIVNDTADPNYEMKAGYEPETGDIIVNRAYIKKGESIEDILTHELGHYIFSDPKFQADFKNFLASMPDDTRAQIEAIINQSYNKDTNQTQIEERQVMAFTALVKANKDTLSKWENFKNTIKRWINKVLRTNIKLSDEGAMAVFNVGFKRFKSGEKIVRAMEEGTLKMAAEPEKPAGEEKPAMERYDKKSQVGGVPGIGAAIDTPKQINAKTETIIKDSVFNSDIVNDNQTKKAWNLIQQLDSANPEAGKNAEAINQLTRETMQDVEAEDIVKQTIGAAKLRNELYKYAMKLTAEGDKKMLDYLLNNRLALAGGAITEGDAGRLLQSLASLKNWIVVATEAEREGFFQMGAQQFFNTKNPTDEQIAQIRDMFNKVKQVKIDQVQALGGELGKVGQATGIDLPAVIDKQLENAPGLDPMIVAIQNLLRMGGTFIYRQFPSKVEQAVKQTISRGITNYRQKMVSKAATGLETGFWKTLSNTEDKPGPLGELDAAQNRELGNIVKSTLVGMGLKGEPPNTKMSIYEQVASILNEQPLKADKIKMADEKIRSGITAKRVAELENARSEGEVDAINHKYDQLESAWDEAMSRQTDMPVSNAMLRRMIFAELKEEKSSMTDLAKLMEEEPAIAISRMDRLVNSIIEKVTGITFDGQPTRDYTSLKTYLDGMLSDLVEKRQTDRRAASEQSKIKKQAGGDPTKQAQAQIDKLAKIQADPTIFGETKIDPVRNAVRDALSLQLNIGFSPAQTAEIKTNWKGAYVADPNQMGIPTSFMLEMQRLGVKEDAANTLAEIVWKQIEVNAMNRQMDSLTKAVEAGPIGGMVQAILDTPLANQQDPEWRKQVIVDYLTNAGVKPSQAENIARLFDLSLRKRFAEAQEAAMDKAAKAIKGGLDPASKKAMEKFRKAIRAQVLDPGTDVAKAFGEQMGWKGFTKEQIVRLNELDAIVNDTTKTEAETFVAIEQINKIIDSVSLPPQIKDILASYYVGNILGRITTFTIQAIDPLFFTGFNAVIESFRNITNPAQFMSVWSNYGRGIANLVRETSFSFKNDVLRSGKLVDYMGRQDRQIGRLLNEAQKKWQRGDIKGAMKDGIFGYTALTFRTLKALDDGAYSLLTTTTLPSYVDAALKRAKVPANKRRGVMRQILEARELDIKNMVEQGTPRNDAIVFANEKMRGEITKVLTGMNIDAQEVIDSAINDSLSRIGKTRFQEDIHGKETEIKDLGFISSPLLRFYEAVARSVNEKGGSESQKIFYRILLGFPLIPARIFNIAAGYTPLTIYRHALKSRYSLTYGTALQRRQRFVEQLAGTAAMLPLLLLRSNSLDEEDEEKKGFGIYITGQGPSRTMDKETRAQWDKRFDPYSAVMRVPGVGSFSIDARSSGPLAVMIYTFGAIDDWENRRKQEGLKTGKDDWRDVHEKASLFTAMYELAGSFALTTARRGPTTGVIQGLVDFRSYPDDPIAAIGKEVAFSGMPAVPILGTGIAKNLSDFFSQPIDNKTKEGAMLSNIPIVGPVAGRPALNAYGQRIGELRVSEKLKKSFGIPFTLIVGDKEEDMKLTSLTLKFGNGPTPIRRAEIEDAIQDVLSDEEWYLAAKTFGDRNSEKVLAGYERYNKMKPDRFNDAMSKITTESKRAAIRAVRLKKSENR